MQVAMSADRKMVVARRLTYALLKMMPWIFACAFCLSSGLRALHVSSFRMLDAFLCAGVLWLPLLFLASYERGYCIWHRILIGYDVAVSFLARMPLPGWVDHVAFVVGLYVCIVAYNRLKKCNPLARNCHSLPND